MRRDEGFRQFHLARVVLPVADQNDRLSSSLLGKLFFAGQVNRVIDGGAAAHRQTTDRLPERFLVFRKILFERHGPIEADHHRKIAAFQSGIQKRNRRRFLFVEDAADAGTLVDQNADGERFSVLVAEALYVLFAAVLFEREVVRLEAGNESSCSISDRERHINEIDVHSERSLRHLLQYCRCNNHQYRPAHHECSV